VSVGSELSWGSRNLGVMQRVVVDRFEIAVPDAAITDLHDRLARTRYAPQTPTTAAPGEKWPAGVPPSYLRELVDFWLNNFDWPAQQAWLNSFPQFVAEIDGRRVHFVHVKSAAPSAIPIVITHGWPYSFIDMLGLVEHLPDFDLVIPSLPGFGFSDALAEPFMDESVAGTWHTLMTEVLGYEKYGTYGEDVGTGISDRLAADYPDSVLGIFATHPPYPPDDERTDLTPAEATFLEWLAARWKGELAYDEEQATKPDTLAAGLSDSPAGLAAWIIEKYQSWSDRTSTGTTRTLDEKFSKTDLLTIVSLYWFTNSVGSSFRPYFDRHRDRKGAITVPAAIAVSRADVGYPRELAERSYRDLRSFTALAHGGHFVAKEEPALVAGAMRSFFLGVVRRNVE
jgi:pimeloyl-ACP methyl ester carboxylesterase